MTTTETFPIPSIKNPNPTRAKNVGFFAVSNMNVVLKMGNARIRAQPTSHRQFVVTPCS